MAALMAVGTSRHVAEENDIDSDNMMLAVGELFEKMHPNTENEVEPEGIRQGFEEAAKHRLTDAELDQLMSEVDEDGGGTIDFEEFAAWMMSGKRLAEELRHKVETKYGRLDRYVDDAHARMIERANSKQFIWRSPEGGLPHTVFVLFEEPGSSTLAVIVGVYIQLLIFIGSVLFVAESLETIKVDKDWITAFHVIEWFCVINFTIEYLIRVGLCWTREGQSKSVVAYATETMNVIDLIAILPSYVEWIFFDKGGGGLEILRVLRMARILRMVKLGSFELYLGLVVESLRRSRVGLSLFLYLVVLFTVIMATFMYMIEGNPNFTNAQPLKFLSIPTTSWCIFVTMSSVGYGDMFPISDEGRILGSVVMVSGILTLAVPITLIGNRFNDVWVEHKKTERKLKLQSKVLKGASGTKNDGDLTDSNAGGGSNGNSGEANAELQSKSAKLMAKGILEHCYMVTGDNCFNEAVGIVWTEADEAAFQTKADEAAFQNHREPQKPQASTTSENDEFSNPLRRRDGAVEAADHVLSSNDTSNDM